MEKKVFVDQKGNVLKEGDFFNLTENIGNLIGGPYQYCGYRSGSHVFRIGNMDFLTSCIKPEFIELMPDWKRWRNKTFYFERFLKYYQEHRLGKENI